MVKERNMKPSDFTPEGGETTGEVSIRMVNYFKTLCQSVYDKNKSIQSTEIIPNETKLDLKSIKDEDLNETILLVSHGLALKMLFIHLNKNLNCEFPQKIPLLVMKNTAFSTFTIR